MSDKNNFPDLSDLSQKYGIPFDPRYFDEGSDEDVKTREATFNSGAEDAKKEGNNSAKENLEDKQKSSYQKPATSSPKVIYDAEKIAFDKNSYGGAPEGPSGKVLLYEEKKDIPISQKRRGSVSLSKGDKRVAISDNSQTFAKNYLNEKKLGSYSPVEKRADGSVPVYRPKDKEAAVKKTQPIHKHYELTPGEKVKKFFRSFLPWKGDKAKEVIRKIVMDISAVLVLVCFGVFVSNYLEYRNELIKQEELESLQDAANDEMEAQWAVVKAKYPGVEFPEGMNIKWADLYAINQDLVGKLTISGTSIDTPVVKAPNDDYFKEHGEDYYLHHNFYKEESKYGAAYLDSYNAGKDLDKNNVIYSHNMTDGLGFAQLEKYYTIDGFKESPIIEYSTLFKDYSFKIYAVIITNGYPEADNNYLFRYITTSFSTDENFQSFIKAIDERKLYDTGVDITKDDKLITLSTCSYEIKKTDMGRLAVIGRLVRDGESKDVDASKAKVNENVRYPQIWYDEHNQKNPFKNSFRWQPE